MRGVGVVGGESDRHRRQATGEVDRDGQRRSRSRGRHRFDRVKPVAETATVGTGAQTWGSPPTWLGALTGVVVVLAFTIFHNAFIVDIWWNIRPMLFAGALCGFSVVWSYRRAVEHSTGAWFRYSGLYAIEIVALGVISLAVLRPRFTMAEALVMDDAMAELTPPVLPLMVGVMLAGTIMFWLYYGQRRGTLVPFLVTQVLLVFLLGHQLAFLGVVESSSTLMVFFGEFALIVFGIAAAFSVGVMWSTILLERLRQPS
jgi:hypothetical protein